MQPGATIKQTKLMLDASDLCILLICQRPVGGVVNVALNSKPSIVGPVQMRRACSLMMTQLAGNGAQKRPCHACSLHQVWA